MPTENEFYLWGESIAVDRLIATGLQAVADALSAYPFAKLLDSCRKEGKEALILEFQVERPQSPPIPIQYRERIALAVNPTTGEPEVYALRRDFPDTPHQYFVYRDEPKRLCLYEDDYRDIRHQLTPIRVLQRVSDWLARAATGTLHLVDQLLEPLMFGMGTLIADPKLFDLDSTQRQSILVFGLSDKPALLEARALPEGIQPPQGFRVIPHLVLPIVTPPYHARTIQFMPRNLAELCELLSALSMDLDGEIEKYIRGLLSDKQFATYKQHSLIVFLKLPKKRTEDGPVEYTEYWAFLLPDKLEELAIKVGVMDRAPDQQSLGVLLSVSPSKKQLATSLVFPLRHMSPMSRLWAQTLAGKFNDVASVVAIGAGALGSQVILNLARQGTGQWAIVDNDLLLPHNLERHALMPAAVGLNKAVGLTNFIRDLLDDPSAASAFANNFLNPHAYDEKLTASLQSARWIMDFSASQTVTRELAHASYSAPRLCAFLGPGGKSLFILSEGTTRIHRLDDLDMQRAAWVASESALHALYNNGIGVVQYAQSCRDHSSQVPQDLMATFSGIVSRFIQTNWLNPSPGLHVWVWFDETFSISHHQTHPQRVMCLERNGWTLHISFSVLQFMKKQRRLRLPNETGGVLLGQFDSHRRIIYIVTALPSPPDSVEWPTLYIRGAEGLRQQVEDFTRLSGGDLSYVGEWHSHPAGCDSQPSRDDLAALTQLAHDMTAEGFPAIVAIQGESNLPNFLVS